MTRQQMIREKTPYVVRRRSVDDSSEGSGAGSGPVTGHWHLRGNAFEGLLDLCWLKVRAFGFAGPYRHVESRLLVVSSGAAELQGARRERLEQGDIVTLPAGGEYSIVALADGFDAIQITFQKRGARRDTGSESLRDVLARNEVRIRAWLKSPYIAMLQDGTLQSDAKRACLKQCLRVFSDVFQTFLFTRQAACRAPGYLAVFHEHLAEEFGHNKLLDELSDPRVRADPSLRATLSWFCYQMLTLDDAGKVVINLVLESAGYHFHNLARPAFRGDLAESYFGTHAEDDEQHQDMGLALIEAEHPDTYPHLVRVVDQGWDMLEATTERIFELVHGRSDVS